MIHSCECNVLFDRSTKKRKSLFDLVDVLDASDCRDASEKDTSLQSDRPQKRIKLSHKNDDSGVDAFRNVRWADDEVPPLEVMEFLFPAERLPLSTSSDTSKPQLDVRTFKNSDLERSPILND